MNSTLQWRLNERDGVSNHQSHDCLFNRLFRHRSEKASKPRVKGLCEGNSSVTGEFPTQRASYTEKIPYDDPIMKYRLQRIGFLSNCQSGHPSCTWHASSENYVYISGTATLRKRYIKQLKTSTHGGEMVHKLSILRFRNFTILW